MEEQNHIILKILKKMDKENYNDIKEFDRLAVKSKELIEEGTQKTLDEFEEDN